MPIITMRHDFRAPPYGPVSAREIYDAAMEQFVWADAHAFDALVSAVVMTRHIDELRSGARTDDPVTRLEGAIWSPRRRGPTPRR